MAGVRFFDLDMADALDVIEHLMVSDWMPHTSVQVADDRVDLHNRARARQQVNEVLGGDGPTERLADADPDTYGTSPQAQAQMAAAMAQIGPAGGAA